MRSEARVGAAREEEVTTSRPEPAPPERLLGETDVTPPPAGVRAPRVIAHRGASARRLENTLESFAEALRLGATALEMDVQRSRDGTLMVFHDLDLTSTTDAGARFDHRRRHAGLLRVADLGRDELRSLGLRPRPDRPHLPPAPLGIPALEEVLSLVGESQAVSGQPVSLYLELKDPAMHADLGLPLEKPLLELLERGGWNVPDGRVALLSSDPESLRTLRFRIGTHLPLGQVVGAPCTGSPSALEGPALDALRRHAELLVLEKGHLAGPTGTGAAAVARARGAGLAVLPYTYRSDEVAPGFGSLEDELRHAFEELQVDGVFTDDPDRAITLLRSLATPALPELGAGGVGPAPDRPGSLGEPVPV